MVCICDGMGTGADAAKTSTAVVDMLEHFFEVGFSERTSVNMVNAAMATRGEESPFTLDLGVFDLYVGKYSMLKFGSMASYIKRRNGVEVVRPSSLPAGLLENAKPDMGEYSLGEGEYVIMVSDGVVDALPFYDKENQMAKIVGELPFANPNLMADKLMELGGEGHPAQEFQRSNAIRRYSFHVLPALQAALALKGGHSPFFAFSVTSMHLLRKISSGVCLFS